MHFFLYFFKIIVDNIKARFEMTKVEMICYLKNIKNI